MISLYSIIPNAVINHKLLVNKLLKIYVFANAIVSNITEVIFPSPIEKYYTFHLFDNTK